MKLLIQPQKGPLLSRRPRPSRHHADRRGHDDRFGKLTQSLSALYPNGIDEKRWVDGVLACKKGLGFRARCPPAPETQGRGGRGDSWASTTDSTAIRSGRPSSRSGRSDPAST